MLLFLGAPRGRITKRGMLWRIAHKHRSIQTTRSPVDGPGSAAIERRVIVGDRGRLVLPAAVRAELGLHEGSPLLLSTESDGSIRLRPYRAVADRGRGMLAGLAGGSPVDELIAERRAAAAAEGAGDAA